MEVSCWQPMATLPYLTEDVPGIGGVVRQHNSDFQVTEIPAYEATGEGDHILCEVEKDGLTTFDAVRILADSLKVGGNDIGTAGLKDKYAVTRQRISLPPPTTPEQALSIQRDDLRVLSAERHPNKLKTGHLRGNEFRLVVREMYQDRDCVALAKQALSTLASPPGSANWFGPQRFGHGGQTAEGGRQIVASGGRGGPRGRKRRLMISAYQSLLFNDYLVLRMERGLYRQVVAGDLAQIRGHSKVFSVEDIAIEQERFDRGEIVVTGPMFGHRVRPPLADSAADVLEREILERHGVTVEDFKPLGKLALGTRRALAVSLGDARVEDLGNHSLALSFSLPSGSYATTLLRELQKTESDAS